MLRYILALLFLALALTPGSGQAQVRVGLVTIEPGDAMFERFGHAALRVQQDGLDMAFSYGAAPFNQPSFVWAFVRGEGQFFVLREPFPLLMRRYRQSDRTVQYQELRLPPEATRQLVAKLHEAARPPHNRYLYDQLYDNCATRLRDLIDGASAGALTRAAQQRKPGRRFRDYTLRAMSGHPLGHWALDLLGGPHQDLPVTGYQEMFLPEHLRDRLADAQLSFAGLTRPLAAPMQVLHRRRAAPALSGRLHAARVVMLLVAAALALCVVVGVRARASVFQRTAAGLSLVTMALQSSLFGLLVVPLTVLSRVHNFSPNENALLFWPSDVLMVPALYRLARRGEPLRAFERNYLAVRLLAVCGSLLFKLLGIFTQHNGTFVVLALLFLLSAAWAARAALRLRSCPPAPPEKKDGEAARPT